MGTNFIEARSTSAVESPIKDKGRRLEKELARSAIVLLLAIMAFYTIHIANNTVALTLPEPIGIVYFQDEPTEFIEAHENYHLHVQMKEEPWIVFYAKYLAGNGCVYEVEAGVTTQSHPVCSLPWMKEPVEGQRNTRPVIVDWYRDFQIEKEKIVDGR